MYEAELPKGNGHQRKFGREDMIVGEEPQNYMEGSVTTSEVGRQVSPGSAWWRSQACAKQWELKKIPVWEGGNWGWQGVVGSLLGWPQLVYENTQTLYQTDLVLEYGSVPVSYQPSADSCSEKIISPKDFWTKLMLHKKAGGERWQKRYKATH